MEHGFTDKFQASLSVEERYISNHGVDGDRDARDDTDAYRFGGITASDKYRLWSPFKDPLGVALRLEGGYSHQLSRRIASTMWPATKH